MAFTFYNYTLTGDCNNTSSGAFSLSYTASSTALYAEWINPISGATFSSGTISNPYVVTGLTGGTYSLLLRDISSNILDDSGVPVNIVVTTGCNITLEVSSNQTCGNLNGAIRAFTTQNDGNNTIILYSGNSEIRSGVTNTNSIQFGGLLEGVYHAKVFDYGGCESTSENVFLYGSTPLNFNFYIVDNPQCIASSGRIYITGVTGTPPFTYLWRGSSQVDGLTSNFVTGLTPGVFSCTVTDFYGCSLTKFATVRYGEQLGLLSYSVVQPTCFATNGSITFTFSGGSAPFYYLLSNGQSQILLSNQVTFTGLSSGNYTLNVTDAGLCTTKVNAALQTPNSFTYITTSHGNQTCSSLGSISANVQGGSPPFNYTLTNNSGFLTNQNTNFRETTFSNLFAGTYTLGIFDVTSACTYSEQIVVQKIMNYDYNLTISSTTCGSSNGSITIDITNELNTGTSYQYSLSNGLQSSFTTATTYTFNNLSSDFYTVNVSDRFNCIVTKRANIETSEILRVNLYPTSCFDGSSGTITALISNHDGPFNITWSENAGGQTGIYITGLTAGTYSVIVSGEGGCTNIATSVVSCNPISATSYSFKYSSGSASNTPTGKKSLKNLMYSGYTSLVENAQNCSLSSATFSVRISIDGIPYQFPFFFTQSFENIPDISYFAGIIESSVLTIPNIDSCVIDVENNVINIVSAVNNNVESYKGSSISFTIIIDYVIICNSINNVVCITPTPTPSITPTMTMTPTVTPTPTITPSSLQPIYFSMYAYNTSEDNTQCYPITQLLFSSSSGLTTGSTVQTDLFGTAYLGTGFTDNNTLSGYTLDSLGNITGVTSAITCYSLGPLDSNCSIPNYYYISNRTPNIVTMLIDPIHNGQPTSFNLPNNTELYGCFCGLPTVSGSSYGITVSAITTCIIN